MSVFVLNALVVAMVASLYVIACTIQWRQHPKASGYSTLDRVAAVIAQVGILTLILAVVVAILWGLATHSGYTLIWS